MAKKISDLTAQTAMAATDAMEVATATPASKKITWANLAQAAFDYLTSLTAKTTVADADQLTLADSAASNVGKKITWANLVIQMVSSLVASTADVIGWSRTVVQPSDVVNDNATPDTLEDVDGLVFPVVAGRTYEFDFFIVYTSAATTTGSRWTANGPALTSLYMRTQNTLSATSNVIAEGLTTWDSGVVSGTSVLAANTATIRGIVTPSASGNVIARFSSEVAGSAITAKAGSRVVFRRVL